MLGKGVRALRKGIVVLLPVISGSFIDCELAFEKVCIKKVLPSYKMFGQLVYLTGQGRCINHFYVFFEY